MLTSIMVDKSRSAHTVSSTSQGYFSDPEYAIIASSLVARIGTLALSAVTAHLLPPFDSSHTVAAPDSSPQSIAGLRWDAVHFASVAVDGYQYEQQLAFMPGWLYSMRYAGQVLKWSSASANGVSVQNVLVGGQLFAIICSAASAVMLYKFTLRLTRNKSLAFMSSIFQTLLPPSPSTHVAPYTETPFAFLTFAGFYFVAGRRFYLASLILGLSSGIRANGILSAGVVGWEMLRTGRAINAVRRGHVKRLVKLAAKVLLCAILVIAPFVIFQMVTFQWMCQSEGSTRPWCHSVVPLSYSFVQGEYWNVGLFKYWTAAQIPNIALAGPIFAVSLHSSATFFSQGSRDAQLVPYHLHHLGMTFLLIFASHSQIALRVCASDPVVWWGIAQIAFEKTPSTNTSRLTRTGKLWVGWAVIWGLVSVILWSGHYPPA